MRRLQLFAFVLGLFAAAPASAADAKLEAIAKAIEPVRHTHGANLQFDAGSELTPVKVALREWVEGRLPRRTPDNNFSPPEWRTFAEGLSSELSAAGLTCADATAVKGLPCESGTPYEFDGRGAVGPITISDLDHGRYVLITTEVGVRCGYDQSAYLYWLGPDNLWTLLIQAQQDDYGKDVYASENFLSVSVSSSTSAWDDPRPPRPLFMTLGYTPWCSSNWNALRERVWRVSGSASNPKKLLSTEKGLYTGDDLIAAGRVTEKDVLIQYDGESIDGSILVRTHIEHYRVGKDDRLERIAPIALTPRDFVEEWASSNWKLASTWLDPAADAKALARAHEPGEFGDADKRCRRDRSVWQVELADRYYLVRWSAPYRFAMLKVQSKPRPDCVETPDMSDAPNTLFPVEEWRP